MFKQLIQGLDFSSSANDWNGECQCESTPDRLMLSHFAIDVADVRFNGEFPWP
jgi:hypothetical protein